MNIQQIMLVSWYVLFGSFLGVHGCDWVMVFMGLVTGKRKTCCKILMQNFTLYLTKNGDL